VLGDPNDCDVVDEELLNCLSVLLTTNLSSVSVNIHDGLDDVSVELDSFYIRCVPDNCISVGCDAQCP
jgi:hypothetical protein